MSLRRLGLAAALLVPLAGGAAVSAELPEKNVLVTRGLSADGKTAGATGEAGGRCWSARLFREQRGGWSLAGERPGPKKTAGATCSPIAGALSADGRTLAVLQLWDATIRVFRAGKSGLTDAGSFKLPGAAGHAFPAPGSNVALSADGKLLLVGSPNLDCEFSVPRDACGAAHLFRHDGKAWRHEGRLPRPPGAGISASFGDVVALSGDGRTAFVGGTGQLGRSGTIHVFARDGKTWKQAGELRPEREDETTFGGTLDVAASGSVAAVGGEQAVHLFERRADGWRRVGRIGPPDALAGTFGASVALNGKAGLLLVGAPRTGCSEGLRCGSAYSYRLVREGDGVQGRLTERLAAPLPVPLTDFGWRVATDESGRRLAVQGRVPFFFGP
ncbi:hypothetical protein SH611_18500 [Geminicoccaceae bacterium 1502E]|nr:hypothetical protein [Geminicoccaceae bacterium 1502E]